MTWLKSIQAGDVLRCAFPLREAPEKPGPKIRPTLAIAVAVQDDKVLVVYGTSQAHEAPQAWQVLVEVEKGTVTLFDFTRRELLPATARYFPPLPGKRSPVIGRVADDRFPEIAAAIKAANVRVRTATA